MANRGDFITLKGGFGEMMLAAKDYSTRPFEDVQRTSDGRFFVLLKVIVDKAEDEG